LDRYAAEFTAACREATRPGLLGPCMLVRREVFDKAGLFDESFSYGGCEDVDFLWQAQKAGITAGVTGAAFIHHFGMVTQKAVKKSGTSAYATQNLAYFQRKWGRTVRGNWLQRRIAGLRDRWMERMEQIRYGHTLVERG
ncbi:MAG: glycosyltransferase family 2 protein, partial [Nitrospirota bacterium]